MKTYIVEGQRTVVQTVRWAVYADSKEAATNRAHRGPDGDEIGATLVAPPSVVDETVQNVKGATIIMVDGERVDHHPDLT